MDIGQIAMTRIVGALVEAEKKFPGFPEDVVHCSGILSEESGEVTKAALDLYYGRESDPEKLMEELAHAGAMALRFLIRMLDPAYYPDQPSRGRRREWRFTEDGKGIVETETDLSPHNVEKKGGEK